jgi:NADPH-dependent 2,4-dienoyl-CoA reductase/sulfur reductase-like enzyme
MEESEFVVKNYFQIPQGLKDTPVGTDEMAAPIQAELVKQGVVLRLNETVVGFAGGSDHAISVELKPDRIEKTDLVILAIGVRPETKLAREAGLEIGQRGGIRVDARMQASDDKIWIFYYLGKRSIGSA